MLPCKSSKSCAQLCLNARNRFPVWRRSKLCDCHSGRVWDAESPQAKHAAHDSSPACMSGSPHSQAIWSLDESTHVAQVCCDWGEKPALIWMLFLEWQDLRNATKEIFLVEQIALSSRNGFQKNILCQRIHVIHFLGKIYLKVLCTKLENLRWTCCKWIHAFAKPQKKLAWEKIVLVWSLYHV